MTDLTQALAELRQMELTYGQLWTAREVMQTQNADNCKSIATVLNAALSGDLIPKADAELQALRDERDRLDAVTNTLSEMWEGEKARAEAAEADITTYQKIVADMTQDAEAATLRAQVERLTGAGECEYCGGARFTSFWGSLIPCLKCKGTGRAAFTEGAAP